MTKEEILHKHIDKESMDELSTNVWPDILDAMEEYLQQQVNSVDLADVGKSLPSERENYNDIAYRIFPDPKEHKPNTYSNSELAHAKRTGYVIGWEDCERKM